MSSMYDKNIYAAARNYAGITQERAAEALGISVESIKAYERYARIPPSHIVSGMCIIYRTDWLAWQHIRLSSGEVNVVPEVEPVDLAQAALRLINRVLAFADQHRDRQLMQIAEDGVIDENERSVFEAIVADLEEIVKAAIEVKVSRKSRED